MPRSDAPATTVPPNRLRVLNPVQALQVMLSLQFTRRGHAGRCAALAALMPSSEARHAFNAFMHTLLARRLAAGRFADDLAERHAVEDLWRDPLVNRRWQRLALRLTADDCECIGYLAAARGLAGSGLRWMSQGAATEGWALESAGYIAPASFEAGDSLQKTAGHPAPPDPVAAPSEPRPTRSRHEPHALHSASL